MNSEFFDGENWLPIKGNEHLVRPEFWTRHTNSEGRVSIIPGARVNGSFTHRPPGPDYAPGAALGLEDREPA